MSRARVGAAGLPEGTASGRARVVHQKLQVDLGPEGTPWLVDRLRITGRSSRSRRCRQVQVLGVGLVEQVVDAGTELDVLAHAVGAVEREHAEACAFLVVLAHHVAGTLGDAVLRRDQAPQRTGAPGIAAVGQAQAAFQRRHLRQRLAIAAVLAQA